MIRQVRALISLIAFFGAAGAYGCGPDDEAALQQFLSKPVADRFREATASGDSRFIAVYGYTIDVPGVPSEQFHHTTPDNVRVLPGTSDCLSSEEHRRLMVTAREYAAKYNALLLARTEGDEVP